MKKRAAAKAIVIHPKVSGVERSMRDDRDATVGFHVMPPPKISGLDELWRVADAGWEWTHIASLLMHVPKAREKGGNSIATMLHIDLAECFSLLEQALRTGKLPEVHDFRAEQSDEMIAVAQEILEMCARDELDDGMMSSADALALLSSAREALAISGADEASSAGRGTGAAA